MKKKFTHLILLLFLALGAFSQPYGNEWINYSQKYFRIPVTKDGIYRIDSITLVNAGIPLTSINPKNFQLFAKGKEQYIYIRGEADGIFNVNDTLEFYGQKNDGFLDSILYGGAVNYPNPYVSLFTDTSMYYLTWNTSLNNLRMVASNDTNFVSFTPNTFIFKEDIRANKTDYLQGTTDLNNVTDPEYLKTESVVCTRFDYGGNFTATMNTANAYGAGPPARIKTRVITGSNDFNLFPDNHIRIQSPAGVFDTIADGYFTFLYSVPVSPSSLAAASPVTISSINPGSSVSSGDAAVSFVSIKYPHTLNLEGLTEFKMYIPPHGAPAKTYLDMTNFNVLGSYMRFYDLTYHRRIKVVRVGGNFRTLVGDSLNAEKFCYITSDNNVNSVISIKPVNQTGFFTNFRLQSGDSAYIIVTNASLMQGANSYKLYRASPQGGSNKVVLADIAELYDQFSFGIHMHPLSVRRFCWFLLNTYPTKPKYLFLIGKSLDPVTARFGSQTPLLPTFGYPPSDNLFTSKLNSTSYAPTIATGRLSANTNSQIMIYLNKVTAYELNTPAAWMKQALHFGGGASSGEQSVFRTYLTSYKNILEADTCFGGHVTSFFKTSSLPIQFNQSDTLKKLIENGVSIMTFFGHASGNGFDQSIDDPSAYNNSPRNPLIIANSCYAGNIHAPTTPTLSVSENFVINPRGSIAFIASTSLGLPGELNVYSGGLYNSIAKFNYARSIGKHIQYAILRREALGNFDLYGKTTVLDMTLHGDPYIVIASPRLPDYAITDPDVYFDTHSQSDSITIFAQVHNYGRAIRDSIFVRLLRKFPNGDTATYKKFVRTPPYIDTVKFKVPVDFSRGVGINRFSVIVDLTNRILEITKANNATGDVDLIIQGSAILPVWPYNDAIIPTDTITLKASTANALEPPRNYKFQIDTTDQYNSPLLKTITLIAKPGGVISWKPPLNFIDSTVYYWRVSPDSINSSNGFRWKESSFQYVNGKRGWAQAHFFQFKNDGLQFLKFIRPARRLNFVNDIKAIEVNNGISVPWFDVNYKINGATMEESSCAIPGFSIAVLDPISIIPAKPDTVCSASTVLPYTAPVLRNIVCDCNVFAFDFYDNSAGGQLDLQNYINNKIPNGSYVIAWTNGFHSIPGYSINLQNAFHSLGASNTFQTVPSNRAYSMIGRKGMTTGQAKELISTSTTQKIRLRDTLVTNWNSGYIASEVIGPARSWGELHWRQKHLTNPTFDSTVIRVVGITASGTQVTLANFPKDSIDVFDLTNYANANVYPYIRLFAYIKNNTNRIAPQIKRWQIIYAPQPEMAVNPPLNFTFKKDTVQEGQPITMTSAIQNISDFNFTDSLLISYWILDRNRIRHNLPSKIRKPPFNSNAWFIDTVTVNTAGYPGLNSLWMEANPVGKPRSQYEQYHYNNLLQKQFLSNVDKINPLMDVTFDGVHILDGDIVSAKPNIFISLKDENTFLALNDTGSFKLFIQLPNSSVAQRIYFGGNISQLTFTKAILPNNSCKINYTPTLPIDGKYLLIVQAKDRSNNASGSLDYQITFEIRNHAMITDVMNYPNPFSTATHFVFTITGSEVPTMFRIQIMTITGKLVREIERDELGSLHIGRNITEYTWDGRDQFGDQLANGVYFYRVLTKIRAENIEHLESGADQYFKKGFGKMYLMR